MTTDEHAQLLVRPQVRPRRILLDRFPVAYEPQAGCRIGLVPRAVLGGPAARGAADGGAVSGASEVVWAAVDPCVVLHTVNAHERDDGLVCVTGRGPTDDL